jgi:hypothetical protein
MERPMSSQQDRRKHSRIGYDMPVEFSLSVMEFGDLRKLELMGKGIDICEQGLGFFIDYPLEPGHVVRIKNVNGSSLTAMVRWVAELDGKFRVGVLFYK